MNESIIAFLQKQTCATICCVDAEGRPHCFNCFYAFHPEQGMLYFKSSPSSLHSQLINKKPFVAGTVIPDKLNKLVVKGIQFEGELLLEHHPLSLKAGDYYHKKHPLSLAMSGQIWAIRINFIKMTDSSVVFGKKTIWNRHAQVPAS